MAFLTSAFKGDELEAPDGRDTQNKLHDSRLSAIDGVFNTYELVEQILLHLLDHDGFLHTPASTLKTILFAQRINKTCLHVVQTSSELQEALFFRPAHDFKTTHQFLQINQLLRGNYREGKKNEIEVTVYFQPYSLPTSYSVPSVYSRRQVTRAGEPLIVESWRKMLLCHTNGALSLGARSACNSAMDQVIFKSDWTMERLCKELFEANTKYMKDLLTV